MPVPSEYMGTIHRILQCTEKFRLLQNIRNKTQDKKARQRLGQEQNELKLFLYRQIGSIATEKALGLQPEENGLPGLCSTGGQDPS